MKRLKKIIAIIVAVGLFVGMIPAQSLLVQAEEVRTLTYASGTPQDSNNRYLIYFNVEGTTATESLPGSLDEYWSNNTVYLDGQAVSGAGVNYSTTSTDTQRQIYLCLEYKVVEATATKASDIGTHLLYIPAGTVIGGITTANDISVKLNGTSVSKTNGVKLVRSGGGNQSASSRYQVVFDVNGVTTFPDTEAYYWNNSKVFIDGIETAVSFGLVNSTYTETTPLRFAAYIEYEKLLSGATTASQAGKHLIEIPAGTFFGDMAVLETVRVLLASGNILDVTEQKLSFTQGGGQDVNSRYLIYLGDCEAPTTGAWGDNDVYIDGKLVEGLEIASQADGQWFIILPYAKIPNGGSTAGTMGSHEIVIPKGSLIGNYITTNKLTIKIENNTIAKKNTLTLELQKSTVNEANDRYDITFSLGDVTPGLSSGAYWNNQSIYVDGEEKTSGVYWAPYTASNTFVLYLDYNTVQEGATSYTGVTDTHIIKIPKGTMIGDIYIENDMILEITDATVKQLEEEPEDAIPQISLDDFGIANGTYGDAADPIYNTCSSSLVGKRFQVRVTPSTTTAGETNKFSSIYYATETLGSATGLKFSVRADGLLTVHNMTGMSSVNEVAAGSYMMYPEMSKFDAAMNQSFLLELFLDFVDYDGRGSNNDAYFRVKVNETVAMEDYFLDAQEVFGNHILIYGDAGNKIKLNNVLAAGEVANPFEFIGVDEDSYIDKNSGDMVIEVEPSIGIPGNPDVEGYEKVAVYSGLPVFVGDTEESTPYDMTKTDHGTFRFTIPKEQIPTSDSFTITLQESPLTYTIENETVELNLISDYVIYVNEHGISGNNYITRVGENVQLTYTSGDVSGISLASADSVNVTSLSGASIYAADKKDSGFFLNGERHQEVFVRNTSEGTYYIALSDVELVPKTGDVAIITGEWELDTVFVDFATIALKYDGSAWEKLEPENGVINGGSVSRDTSDDEWLVDGANATVNGASIEQGTVLYKPGNYVINSTIGDVTMSQTVSLYHPGDVNVDNAYEVADLVRVKKHQNNNSADTVAGQLAADKADLTDLRKTLIGKTKTDDALPTEIVGETSAGTYITSVDASANGTTVIGMADEDNNYQVKADDFDDYGFDYVLDFNNNRPIKILQLTDTQTIDSSQERYEERLDAGSEAAWAPTEEIRNKLLFNYIKATVEAAKPDLILLTGDIIYGEFDDNGENFLDIVEYMDGLKIPWAPVYGNHENESRMGVEWQNEQLTNSPYCLFNARHEIEGNGNYTIGISHNGELERVVYMMDSNGVYEPWWSTAYWQEKDPDAVAAADQTSVKRTQGFSMKQKNWYRTMALRTNDIAGKTIPSILGYHIGSIEYLEAAKAACYQSTDSAEVKYTIGTNVTAQPGDSGYKGNGHLTREEPHLLDYMHEVGTDGTFIGHQHSINTSVYYDGIRWTYGVKTGMYCDYPSEMGGTLIKFNDNSSTFEVERIIVNP